VMGKSMDTTIATERPCPDDLVVRGQRQALSELERRVLKAHLEQCASCRAASALTALFDVIPEIQPGDSQLITRVMDKAIRTPRQRPRWRGLRAAAVLALAVLTGGAAVAGWIAHQRIADQRRIHGAPTPGPLQRAPASRPRNVSPLAAPSPMPSVPEMTSFDVGGEARATTEPPRKRRTSLRTTDMVPSVAEPPPPSPAALFAHANAVRRAGDVREAIILYQTLRQQFPDSSQALLSAISMGDLLLGEGDAVHAVAAYGAYLQYSPRGSLTEEALFGKARGLALLGRATEEKQTWEELVRRFPRSAYQPAASRRLKELTH
jgi:TolA-binding protein